jgi:TRAP-type transport system periplasmic protein
MKTLRRWMLTAGLSLLTSLAVTPASAQETWKLGTAAQPGSVLYDIVMKFINDFNAASGSELKLEYQLIGNEQEMHQQVVRGRIQMGASSFAGGSILVPEGAVFNTPFQWPRSCTTRRAWSWSWWPTWAGTTWSARPPA